MMNIIRKIRGLFKITGGGKLFIMFLLLRCPFDALFTFIKASFLQYGFNSINNKNINELYFVCMIFCIESLILFLYNGTVWTMNATYITKWLGTMRKKVFGHIASNLSLQRIESQSSGEWFTRLNYTLYSATAIVTQPVHLSFVVLGITNVCISSAILFFMNPVIFGLIILFVIPNILANQYITKPVPELWRVSLKHSANNATDFNALITCADTAILYDAQGFLMKRFEESSLSIRRTNMKMRRRFSLDGGLSALFGMGGYLVLLLIGSGWINSGMITFGSLTAAFQYRSGILVGSGAVIGGIRQIQSSIPAVNTLNEIMNIPVEE